MTLTYLLRQRDIVDYRAAYFVAKNLHFTSVRLKIKLMMSCGIPDISGDEFIITGGYKEETRGTTEVSVYNKDGWQSNLASLNQARFGHGCTSFIKDGKLVWVKIKQMKIGIIIF